MKILSRRYEQLFCIINKGLKVVSGRLYFRINGWRLQPALNSRKRP